MTTATFIGSTTAGRVRQKKQVPSGPMVTDLRTLEQTLEKGYFISSGSAESILPHITFDADVMHRHIKHWSRNPCRITDLVIETRLTIVGVTMCPEVVIHRSGENYILVSLFGGDKQWAKVKVVLDTRHDDQFQDLIRRRVGAKRGMSSMTTEEVTIFLQKVLNLL
jgi:hypothetical protein